MGGGCGEEGEEGVSFGFEGLGWGWGWEVHMVLGDMCMG